MVLFTSYCFVILGSYVTACDQGYIFTILSHDEECNNNGEYLYNF